MTDTLRDRFGALTAKWREGRVMTNIGIDMQLHGGEWVARLCADELEAALAAQPAPAVMGEDCNCRRRVRPSLHGDALP